MRILSQEMPCLIFHVLRLPSTPIATLEKVRDAFSFDTQDKIDYNSVHKKQLIIKNKHGICIIFNRLYERQVCVTAINAQSDPITEYL